MVEILSPHIHRNDYGGLRTVDLTVLLNKT